MPGDDLGAGEQDCRVQVALDRTRGAQTTVTQIRGHPGGGDVQRGLPVDSDDVRADGGHLAEQFGGVDPEVDHRHPVGSHGVEDALRVRGHELPVVLQGEESGPGVEELECVDTCLELGAQEGDDRGGQLLHQRMPCLRLGVHQRLGDAVVLRGAAFDEVGRQGERGTGETDEHLVVPQLVEHSPDALDHRLQLTGLHGGQRGDVCGGAHRMLQHRATAGDDVDGDTGGLERDDDVGEEDRGVGVMAADRLQGDLGEEIGAEAGVEHLHPGAQFAVLGQ